MPTLRDFINAQLDRVFNGSAGGMLRIIASLSTSPGARIQLRLRALEDEAGRLSELEKRFNPNSAEIRAMFDDTNELFRQVESIILANDNAIQDGAYPLGNTAVKSSVALTINPRLLPPGVNPFSAEAIRLYDELLLTSGITWQMLQSPQALSALNYVESEAWKTRMDRWGSGVADRIRETILKQIANGRTPIGLARDIRHLIENMPTYAAENLTRTLQLTAFRDTERYTAAANSDVISYKVRRAVKDQRTCLSCIALDGTRLQPEERIDDHYQGRCFATYVLTNGMGDVNKPTGEEWFNSLSPERQAQQASFAGNRAKYDAWKAGEFRLKDVVGDHDDDVFGHMFHEKSLKQILGEAKAKEFYTWTNSTISSTAQSL
jgi:hypothetical protein